MKTLLIIVAFCFTAATVEAQNLKPYWVIETTNKKDNTILRIYDVQNVMIHEVMINGKVLNVLARKDRKRINKKVKEILNQEALASGKKIK